MVPRVTFPTMKLLLAVFACAAFLSAYLLVSAAQDQPPRGRRWQTGRRTLRQSDASLGNNRFRSPDSMVIKTDDGKTVTVAITSELASARIAKKPSSPISLRATM